MALSEAYNILCYISLVSVLIPILLFVLKIKAPNKSLRALFIYLVIYLVTDVIGFILMLQDKSTTILFNIFTIIEFELICYIFHSEINNFKAKKFIQAIGVLFLIFALSFFGRHFDEGGDLVSSVEALLVVVFSSLCFYKFLIDETILKLENEYFYWVNLSFLIYFCAAFLIFMNNSFLENCNKKLAFCLYSLHQLANITCNIIFSIGIWKTRQTQH